MSTNEKKPNAAFTQDFIDSAINLVNYEGRSLELVAKSINVPYRTLRQWCIKAAQKRNKSIDWQKMAELESHARKLRKRIREVELEPDILKKATEDLLKNLQ